METIQLRCKNCKKITIVNKTQEIPKNTNYISATCCPECDAAQKIEYEENYVPFRKKRVTKIKNPKLF